MAEKDRERNKMKMLSFEMVKRIDKVADDGRGDHFRDKIAGERRCQKEL